MNADYLEREKERYSLPLIRIYIDPEGIGRHTDFIEDPQKIREYLQNFEEDNKEAISFKYSNEWSMMGFGGGGHSELLTREEFLERGKKLELEVRVVKQIS